MDRAVGYGAGDLVDPCDHLPHRDVHGCRRMPGSPLVVLPDVEQHGIFWDVCDHACWDWGAQRGAHSRQSCHNRSSKWGWRKPLWVAHPVSSRTVSVPAITLLTYAWRPFGNTAMLVGWMPVGMVAVTWLVRTSITVTELLPSLTT